MSDPTKSLAPPPPTVPENVAAAAPATVANTEHTLVAPAGAPPAAREPLACPSGYELSYEIGRGGMGVVYRARDLTLDRSVAVKLLQEHVTADGAAARRFVEEAKITGQLQHPGIPPVHQVGTLANGRPYLVMKLIRGHTLDALLRERIEPAANPGRFLAVFEQICQAVGYAHSHKVIHRDLKPGNVMVGAFGEVQVMDWGLAKTIAEGDSDRAEPDPEGDTLIRSTRERGMATRAGSVMGTPAFMPPEQAGGEIAKIDRRSDVFALGGVLCAILTGQPPYVGNDTNDVYLKAVRGETGDALGRLDRCGAEPELVALCRRCLSLEPAARPKDADELARAVADLRAAAEERARNAALERVRTEGELAKATEQRKHARAQLLLTVAVGLLALGAGVFAWWADRQESQRKNAEANRVSEERGRQGRNGVEIASLVDQCEKMLGADDAIRAALLLAQADARETEGGGDEFASRLARCRRDLAFLRELDRIDELRWAIVAGHVAGTKVAVAEWPKAFANYGITPGTTPAAKVASRFEDCLVREHALRSLDLWLLWSRSPQVAAALHAADPNDYRDSVRAALVQRWPLPLLALAGNPVATNQPPRFAAVLGELTTVPLDRRTELLLVALRKRPDDFGLLMTLGSLPRPKTPEYAGEYEKWYRAAVAVRPTSAAAHNNLAGALSFRKDWDGAIAEAEEAARIDPLSAIARSNLGLALRQKGDLDAAIRAHREAVRLDPEDAMSRSALGRALYDRQDYPAAAASYREAIRIDPTDAATHSNLGGVLDSMGDYDGAIKACREAIRIDPNFAPAHNHLGNSLKAKKNRSGAIAAYRESIRIDPDHFPASLNLGTALREMGDYRGAIAIYQEVIRRDPKFVEAHYQLGGALHEKGDVPGAIAAYRETIRLDPKKAYGHASLGDALGDKGDADGAIAAYREALRLDPKIAPAHNNLGLLLLKKDDADGAVAAFQASLRLEPDDLGTRFNLSLAQLAQKKQRLAPPPREVKHP
jgi:tetratricopeptide (TPR) repeat protein